MSLYYKDQTKVIESLISTSRYLDDLLNIDNPNFKNMVSQIYPDESEFQLIKASSSDTEVLFSDLGLIHNQRHRLEEIIIIMFFILLTIR